MNFKQALAAMLEGKSVKRPSWLGYWAWDSNAQNIRMHLKDGKSLLLTDTDDPLYTYQQLAAEDFAICGGGQFMPVNTFSFSDALRFMKDGRKVARAGWNGKGMFLNFVANGQYDVGCAVVGDSPENYRNIELLPWIGMKTADNKFVPWLASQTDMLSNDWCVVP